MIFEHAYDLGARGFPSRNFDAISCTSSNIDHLFEFRMFECLDGLETQEISSISYQWMVQNLMLPGLLR